MIFDKLADVFFKQMITKLSSLDKSCSWIRWFQRSSLIRLYLYNNKWKWKQFLLWSDKIKIPIPKLISSRWHSPSTFALKLCFLKTLSSCCSFIY